VGYNVVFGLISGFTDNACHIGGLLAGVVLGALIAKVAPGPQPISRRFAVLLLVAVLLAGGTFTLQRSRPYHIHRMRSSEHIKEQKIDAALGSATPSSSSLPILQARSA
jgi:hypothetical protein